MLAFRFVEMYESDRIVEESGVMFISRKHAVHKFLSL
jgi:hypothetical protein